MDSHSWYNSPPDQSAPPFPFPANTAPSSNRDSSSSFAYAQPDQLVLQEPSYASSSSYLYPPTDQAFVQREQSSFPSSLPQPPHLQRPANLASQYGTPEASHDAGGQAEAGTGAGEDEKKQDGPPVKLSNARMPKKAKPREPAKDGVIVTDKSCARCRIRKVRCNRVFPRCDHCIQRNEDCDLKDWKPKPKVKPTDPHRVAALEKRLAELEEQLGKNGKKEDEDTGGAKGMGEKEELPLPHAQPSMADFHLPPSRESFNPLTAFSTLASSSLPSALPATNVPSPSSSTSSAALVSSIGHTSINWRLALPTMASSLSRSLTEAFWDSCCALMPNFLYFRGRMNEFLEGRMEEMSPVMKVAATAFIAMGTRTSPHSAVLGISLRPSDTVEHPSAPLLSAGTRRQSATDALFTQAHELNFAAATADVPSVENLAALLSLLQLTLFSEVQPVKSRPLLRAAVGHFKELQDEAETEQERGEIRRQFGYALWTSDCLVAACARRKPLITDDDLRSYFSHADTKIVVPRLTVDNLLPIVQKLVRSMPNPEVALNSAKHLLSCWTAELQRTFAVLAAPPLKRLEEIATGIRTVWKVIDSTRAAAQFLLTVSPPATNDSHPHSHSHSHSHAHASGTEDPHSLHEHDYGAQILRIDRDLLDLVNLVHGFIGEVEGKASYGGERLPEEIRRESLSRVRKSLKERARALRAYVVGVDVHMTFHELYALELLPNWTELAMQRIGPGGPTCPEEEVSETELSWFIEGLQHACFYHPKAEKRLVELDPRFSEDNVKLHLSPPPTSAPLPTAGGKGASPGFGWADSFLSFPSPPSGSNPLSLPATAASPSAAIPPAGTPTPPTFPLGLSTLFGPTGATPPPLPFSSHSPSASSAFPPFPHSGLTPPNFGSYSPPPPSGLAGAGAGGGGPYGLQGLEELDSVEEVAVDWHAARRASEVGGEGGL
ncbi:hypothetical protein JCM8547_004167 [Rhodosporidiobolus lusitaniae]